MVTIEDILKIKTIEPDFNCKKLGDISFSGVSIDSRTIKSDDLFVAIKGEQFDGHDFINDIIKKKVKVSIIASDKYSELLPLRNSIYFLKVQDTLKALQELLRKKGIEIKDEDINAVIFRAGFEISKLKAKLEEEGKKIDEKTIQTILANIKVEFLKKVLGTDNNYKKLEAQEIQQLLTKFQTLPMAHPLYTENKLLFMKDLLLKKYLHHLKLYEPAFIPNEAELLEYYTEHNSEFSTFEYEYVYLDLEGVKEIARLYKEGKFDEIKRLLKTKYKHARREKITTKKEQKEYKTFLADNGHYACPILIKKTATPFMKVRDTILNKLLLEKLKEKYQDLIEDNLENLSVTAGPIKKIHIRNISENYDPNMATIIHKSLRSANQSIGNKFDFKKLKDFIQKIKEEYGYHLTWKIIPTKDGKVELTLTILDKTTWPEYNVAGGWGNLTGFIANVGLKGINILDSETNAGIDVLYGQHYKQGTISVGKTISEDDTSLRTSTSIYVAQLGEAITGGEEQERIAAHYTLTKIINDEFTVSGTLSNRTLNGNPINSMSAGLQYNPNWFKPLTLFLVGEKGLGHQIYKLKGGAKLRYAIPGTKERLQFSHHVVGVVGMGDDYYLLPHYQGELVRGAKNPLDTGRYGWGAGTDIEVMIIPEYFGVGVFFDIGGIGNSVGSPEIGFGPQVYVWPLGRIGFNALSQNIFFAGNIYSW